MKDKVFYFCEGFTITLAGYHWFEQAVLPILVACVGAVLTVIIQHFLKRWLNTRSKGLPNFKDNGKEKI